MKRRQTVEQAPTFQPADVYRLRLLGIDRYRAERGEPCAALLAALAEHDARRARHADAHHHRDPADWAEDAP